MDAAAAVVAMVFWGACIIGSVVLPLMGYSYLNIGRRA